MNGKAPGPLPPTLKISVLGLGLMGLPVAGRLQQSGFDVAGWNRGEARADEGRRQGLRVCRGLAEAVSRADLLVLTLSDFEAIEDTLFCPGSPNLAGKQILQMGTIAPGESRILADRSAEQGAGYIEAPVLGSVPEARSGTLIMMAGGEADDFEALKPVLSVLSAAPVLVGPAGAGAALKLAMNQLIASLTVGFATSLGLVQAEGLSVELFMELLRKSALYAPTFDKKLSKMLSHDYANPNFPLKHLIKDVELFRRAAPGHGIDPRGLSAILEILEQGRRDGRGDQDYSALFEVIRGRAGDQ